jgi:hypothetical protein
MTSTVPLSSTSTTPLGGNVFGLEQQQHHQQQGEYQQPMEETSAREQQQQQQQQQSKRNLTQLELDLKTYFLEGEGDDSETEFLVSSWIEIAGEEGTNPMDCHSLVKALDLPIHVLNNHYDDNDNDGDQEISNNDVLSTCLALPYLWVGTLYLKRHRYTTSWQYHRLALKVQLQSVGQYEPLTVEILQSMAKLYDTMNVDAVIVDDTITPSSQQQQHRHDHTTSRQRLEDAALRIQWKIYGKEWACSMTSSSSQRQYESHHRALRCNHSTNMTVSSSLSSWESLQKEMMGDHLLFLARDITTALSMYHEAALFEFMESGSHNMNLALIYRKIAILTRQYDDCLHHHRRRGGRMGDDNDDGCMTNGVGPVDSDPFGIMFHIPPTRRNFTTSYLQRSYLPLLIRRGDNYLVNGRYEAAIRTYTKSTTTATTMYNNILHPPTSSTTKWWSIGMGMMILVLLHVAIHVMASFLLLMIRQKHIPYLSSTMSVIGGMMPGNDGTTMILLDYLQRIKDSVLSVFHLVPQNDIISTAEEITAIPGTPQSPPASAMSPICICDDHHQQQQQLITTSNNNINLHDIPVHENGQTLNNNSDSISNITLNDNNDEKVGSLLYSNKHHDDELVVATTTTMPYGVVVTSNQGQEDFCTTTSSVNTGRSDGDDADNHHHLHHHNPELLLLDSVHSVFGRHSFESLGSIMERDYYPRD